MITFKRDDLSNALAGTTLIEDILQALAWVNRPVFWGWLTAPMTTSRRLMHLWRSAPGSIPAPDSRGVSVHVLLTEENAV